ncbi:MAG: NAD-dependent epimerase/dehydratase family protein, partial [Chloroflexi bacterium]|nr:NAD-dependent epimerase/dehydratase family protein [Chloroflexota bacterium]
MATGREIQRRMRSVRNIRQITKAMELIAVTRLRRAQQRVLASRPYSSKMRELIGEIATQAGIRFVWMRIFSIYGPLDTGAWLIPNIVDSLVSDKRIALTKGEQQWSYLHAYDLALGFQKVIEKYDSEKT